MSFIASKRADPTLNFQQPYRRFLSAGLNAALQVLFRYSGTDTHGPKLLNRDSLSAIIAKCELDRGQFDTELVLRAMRGSKRLVEVPVEYRELRPHRNLMIKKIFWNLVALRRLQHVMRDVPFEGEVRYYRFAREDVTAAKDRRTDHAARGRNLFNAPQPRSRLYTSVGSYAKGLPAALLGIGYESGGTGKLEHELDRLARAGERSLRCRWRASASTWY